MSSFQIKLVSDSNKKRKRDSTVECDQLQKKSRIFNSSLRDSSESTCVIPFEPGNCCNNENITIENYTVVGIVPLEIWCHIFKFIRNPIDALSLKLSCKFFKSCIDISFDYSHLDYIAFKHCFVNAHTVELERLLTLKTIYNGAFTARVLFPCINCALRRGNILSIKSILPKLGPLLTKKDFILSLLGENKFNIEFINLLFEQQKIRISLTVDDILLRYQHRCESDYSFIKSFLLSKLELLITDNSHKSRTPSLTFNDLFIRACEKSDIEIVKILLFRFKVDPSTQDQKAIYIACSNGYFELIKLLIEDPRVNITYSRNRCFTILCEFGRLDIIEYLLIQNTRTKNQIKPHLYGQVAIRKACAHGHIEIVRLLLRDNRINPSTLSQTSLIKAITENHINIVELLISHPRINPCYQDFLPLRIAINSNRPEIVEIISKRSDVKPNDLMSDNWFTCLTSAYLRRETKSLWILLQAGKIDVSLREHKLIKDLIEIYAHYSDADFIVELFRHPSAAISSHSSSGQSILSALIRKKSCHLVRQFLNLTKFDPSIQDQLALRDAVFVGNIEIVKIFLAHGQVDPAPYSKELLLSALSNNNIFLFRTLLEDKRIDPSINEQMVLVESTKKNQWQAIEILLQDSRVNPTVCNNLLLRQSLFFHRIDIIQSLLKDSRVIPCHGNRKTCAFNSINSSCIDPRNSREAIPKQIESIIKCFCLCQ